MTAPKPNNNRDIGSFMKSGSKSKSDGSWIVLEGDYCSTKTAGYIMRGEYGNIFQITRL
ncbi:MAG TPA: hypothetical protein VN239_09410 [Nitrososphaera sp.]|nr:hypothetical protein [Nitrososphaera sp.]